MHIIYPCIKRIPVSPEAQDEEPDEEDQEVDREDEVLHAGEAALVPHFHPFRGFSLEVLADFHDAPNSIFFC